MRKTWMLALAVLVLAASASVGVADDRNKGDLPTSLMLLNLGGKQPEVVNALYAAAYNALATRREATFADVAADKEVQRICKANGIVHLGGPMLGTLTADGARVWLRTVNPAAVTVEVTAPDGVVKTFGPVQSSAATDMTAVVKVTGLAPNTRNPYRVLLDGKPIKMPADAAITTAPDASEPSKVRITFGSCFHRWGLSNAKQVETILSRKPTAMLLYGDIAVQDRTNNLNMHRADYLLRDFQPPWKALTAQVPVYATWDDHDYFHNDRAGIPKGFVLADKQGVCDVFKRAWNNPSYGFGDDRRGVFLRTRIGPADVIMVDNRYFRENKPGSFLGDEQMKWLQEQLLDCKGPFIILSCGTMWSDYVSNGKDSWGKWDPEGREKIFQLIEKNRIGGVLLVSGDRHGARGFTITRPSGFKFYEFEPGSLGGRSGPPAKNPKWTEQLFGISGKYAFGEFTIDATVSNPTVTFRLIGDDASTIYETTLTRSQLIPPEK